MTEAVRRLVEATRSLCGWYEGCRLDGDLPWGKWNYRQAVALDAARAVEAEATLEAALEQARQRGWRIHLNMLPRSGWSVGAQHGFNTRWKSAGVQSIPEAAAWIAALSPRSQP